MSIYIFAYGSLINMEQNIELNNSIHKKICPVTVKGLKRSLNVGGKNYRVFGVKDVKASLCNGVLFKVTERELDNLIEREKLYTIKPLSKNRIVFNYTKCITFKPNDKVVCFYPMQKNVLTKNNLNTKPINNNYLQICIEGASKISNPFLDEFVRTTVI
jgi:hypothetical protein